MPINAETEKFLMNREWEKLYDRLKDEVFDIDDPIKGFVFSFVCSKMGKIKEGNKFLNIVGSKDLEPPPDEDTPNYEEEYRKWFEARISRQKIKEFAAWVKELKKKYPENTVPFDMMGFVLSGDANTARAAYREYTEALKITPHDTDLIFDRGSLLSLSGQNSQAIEDFNRLTELEPEKSRAYRMRHLINFMEKKYGEAIADADKIIEMEPENAEFRYMRGFVRHNMEEYEKALEDFNDAINLGPVEADFFEKRAKNNIKLKRKKEAREDAEKFRELKEKEIAEMDEPGFQKMLFEFDFGCLVRKIERMEG